MRSRMRATWSAALVLSAAGWLGGLSAAHAVQITLTQAFQPGDYFISGNTNSNNNLYQIRPSNPAASRVISTITVGSGNDAENVYGTFRANGDFYYTAGVSLANPNHKGIELWRIPAGATTATKVISDLRPSGSSNNVYSVAVAADGTAYALQSDGMVRKWVPDGVGNYTTGTNLGNVTSGYSNPTLGATVRLSQDDKFLLSVGSSGSSPLASINTSTGTVSTLPGSATGPFYKPFSFDIDYANGLNGSTYRVLVSSQAALNGDGTNRRVTEVAFNPTTGVVSNPYSGGTGNLSGLGAGYAESYLLNTNHMDQIAFDNDGNLIALSRGNAPQTGVSITQAGLNSHTSTTAFSSFPTVWGTGSNGVSFSSIRSFDIAPVPEPGSFALLLCGGLMWWGFYRKRGTRSSRR